MKSPAKTKISLNGVFKVFGDNPMRAMHELGAGKSKAQIHSDLGPRLALTMPPSIFVKVKYS
ncbi:glycine/betaine/L-proline ABC transporter ATP-binding protein [Brucella sp. 10RB9215]|nr:glycine/betaine/L-proline ABC transporter ATP-binding protein [Brucella sp. 10RB9215]